MEIQGLEAFIRILRNVFEQASYLKVLLSFLLESIFTVVCFHLSMQIIPVPNMAEFVADNLGHQLNVR